MKIPLVLTACVQFHVDHLWCGYRLVNCWAFHQSAFPVLKYTNYAKRLFRLEHFQVKTKQMKESLNEREEKKLGNFVYAKSITRVNSMAYKSETEQQKIYL